MTTCLDYSWYPEIVPDYTISVKEVYLETDVLFPTSLNLLPSFQVSSGVRNEGIAKIGAQVKMLFCLPNKAMLKYRLGFRNGTLH